MDAERGSGGLRLDGAGRGQLLDLIARTAGDLSGCITTLGEGPGADPAMAPTLARVSQQVWDAVRGPQSDLLHLRPWPDRGDPEVLMRAFLADKGWDAGQLHGRAGETPYRTGALSPGDYLARVARGDDAGQVLDGIGLGKWAADPAAEVAASLGVQNVRNRAFSRCGSSRWGSAAACRATGVVQERQKMCPLAAPGCLDRRDGIIGSMPVLALSRGTGAWFGGRRSAPGRAARGRAAAGSPAAPGLVTDGPAGPMGR